MPGISKSIVKLKAVVAFYFRREMSESPVFRKKVRKVKDREV